jgi:hypothetical protein
VRALAAHATADLSRVAHDIEVTVRATMQAFVTSTRHSYDCACMSPFTATLTLSVTNVISIPGHDSSQSSGTKLN